MRPVATPVMVEARYLFSQLARPELPQIEGQPDPDARLPGHRIQYLMSVAMVAAGAEAWEGLQDEDGQDLEQPTAEQVLQLFNAEPWLFDWFDDRYCTALYLMMTEKKGSPPSATGTSLKAGRATAADAKSGSATKPVPAPTT